jgi:hypothetical protein
MCMTRPRPAWSRTPIIAAAPQADDAKPASRYSISGAFPQPAGLFRQTEGAIPSMYANVSFGILTLHQRTRMHCNTCGLTQSHPLQRDSTRS